MKTITIKVFDWFPTPHDLRHYKRKFKMWLFPPRCVDCNKRVKTNEFYWGQRSRTGTHPSGIKDTVSDFAIRVSRPYCVRCMKWFLHNLPIETGNCTMCEAKNVPILGYRFIKEPKTFITFLWHWWNGSTFCMKCVDELLDKGEPATDFYVTKIINGKAVTIPEFY